MQGGSTATTLLLKDPRLLPDGAARIPVARDTTAETALGALALPPGLRGRAFLLPGGRTWQGGELFGSQATGDVAARVLVEGSVSAATTKNSEEPKQPTPRLVVVPGAEGVEHGPVSITFQGVPAPQTQTFPSGATFRDATARVCEVWPEFHDPRTFTFMVRGGKTPAPDDPLANGLVVRVMKTQRKHVEEQHQTHLVDFASRIAALEKAASDLATAKRHRMDDADSLVVRTAAVRDEADAIAFSLRGLKAAPAQQLLALEKRVEEVRKTVS